MRVGRSSDEKGMRYLLTTIGFVFLFAAPVFAAENSLLARVTVYWPGEGQVRACSNGARLRAGHCAVDPKRIPFGSRVLFPDTACVAVDSGPDVVNRKAARVTGRTASQRNAIVIDRFFESKEAALAWERSHPHFMTVRVVQSESREELTMSKPEMPRSETRTVALPDTDKLEPRVNADGTELAGPIDPLMRSARRRAL
jgi:3D (Asp-Asp-Asp) domain-containing protein